MMSSATPGALVLALLAAGVGVTVAASLLALTLPAVYDRLHLLAPVTSLGAPLVGVALAIWNGWTLTTGQIVLTVALLTFSGPVLETATGRVAAQRERLVPPESPQ